MSPRRAASCCRTIERLLDPVLFRALCDPTRASLVACLIKCGRACTVTEVAECCDVDFSVVSRHLTMLAEAGVLESKRAGRSVAYVVRYHELSRQLRELAAAIEEYRPDAVAGRRARCE